MQGKTDKTASRIRRMFGTIAPTYDLLNRLLSLSIDRHWRRDAARLTLETGDAGAPVRRVLDLATGTGDLALAFARRLGPDVRLVGADFARPMLRIARAKWTERRIREPLAPFLPVEADAHALPFPDATFDIVAVAFGVRNMERPGQALRELTRVVRPGGRVAILEFAQPPNPLFRRLFRFYFHRFVPWVGAAVSRSDAYRYLPDSVAVFWNVREFRRRLKRAGLDPVKSWWFSGGIAGLHIGQKPPHRQPPTKPQGDANVR